MNDANKAALAALFGITPETHRHLYRRSKPGEFVAADLLESLYGADHDTKPYTLIAPDPLGPDADGVWLVPMLLWCKSKGLEPLIDGEYGPWNALIQYDGLSESVGESPTAALLQACLAARVPEVCAILEVSHA